MSFSIIHRGRDAMLANSSTFVPHDNQRHCELGLFGTMESVFECGFNWAWQLSEVEAICIRYMVAA